MYVSTPVLEGVDNMFRKAMNLIKKILFVCLVVCCVLLILYGAAHAFFHNIPISKTPVDVSLSVTKLNAAGEPIDTFPVAIKGNIEEYLFQNDRLNVYIEPFDGYTDFRQHNDSVIFPLGDILYWTTYCATGNSGNEFFYLYFTEDFEQVAILVEQYKEDTFSVNARYVASSRSDIDHEEVIEFLGGMLRFEK